VLDAAAIAKACEQGIARARDDLAQTRAEADPTAFFAAWNRHQIVVEDAFEAIGLMGRLHPDKAVRDAAEPCLTRVTEIETETLQDEALFARVKAARPTNAIEEKLKKDLIAEIRGQRRRAAAGQARRGRKRSSSASRRCGNRSAQHEQRSHAGEILASRSRRHDRRRS
jgi:thimet oligopeptidase